MATEIKSYRDLQVWQLGEFETQLSLAVALEYLEAPEAEPLFARCQQLGKMLTSLKHALSLYSHHPSFPTPHSPHP
jgi:hypothetical protein